MSTLLQGYIRQSSHQFAVLNHDSSNPFLKESYFLLLDDVSIQQVSDTVFLIRCYPPGKNYPEPHEITISIVIDDVSYYAFAYLSRDGSAPSLKHHRQIHGFFRELGLRPSYTRGKHIEKPV